MALRVQQYTFTRTNVAQEIRREFRGHGLAVVLLQSAWTRGVTIEFNDSGTEYPVREGATWPVSYRAVTIRHQGIQYDPLGVDEEHSPLSFRRMGPQLALVSADDPCELPKIVPSRYGGGCMVASNQGHPSLGVIGIAMPIFLHSIDARAVGDVFYVGTGQEDFDWRTIVTPSAPVNHTFDPPFARPTWAGENTGVYVTDAGANLTEAWVNISYTPMYQYGDK